MAVGIAPGAMTTLMPVQRGLVGAAVTVVVSILLIGLYERRVRRRSSGA